MLRLKRKMQYIWKYPKCKCTATDTTRAAWAVKQEFRVRNLTLSSHLPISQTLLLAKIIFFLVIFRWYSWLLGIFLVLSKPVCFIIIILFIPLFLLFSSWINSRINLPTPMNRGILWGKLHNCWGIQSL